MLVQDAKSGGTPAAPQSMILVTWDMLEYVQALFSWILFTYLI